MVQSSNSTISKKTNKATSAAANKALAETNGRLEAQLVELCAQLAAAQAQATAPATAPLPAAAVSAVSGSIKQIPGEHGRQYNLAKMLSNHGVSRREYNHMLSELDCKAHYRAQDPIKIVQIIAVMRKKFPILKAFASDWVTIEMLKQSLRNWRAKAKADDEELGMGSNVIVNDEEIANSRIGSPEI
ncbi:hypothetical protein FRC17_007020 [Serendipita sp. 399]|nr:hypothetical protein FRC17_007020 [Serendipita sp. 399]